MVVGNSWKVSIKQNSGCFIGFINQERYSIKDTGSLTFGPAATIHNVPPDANKFEVQSMDEVESSLLRAERERKREM
ncbi:Hypothetical predicted protein [Olea europaea subsp. europaea]|nr:Hypothetical predicted protein [Olea europaea subsp. europaea]